MLELGIVDHPATAATMLDPVRCRLLAALRQPGSAATLAKEVGLPRQKVNYHLHRLEAHGLVEPAGERRWGGLTERLMVATAASYVVAPAALGEVAADPERDMDRLSASYLIALAARVVGELGELVGRARLAKKHLATLSIDAVIRFRTAQERAAFSAELADAVKHLVAKYHDDVTPGGRAHRLVLLAHPCPLPPDTTQETLPCQ